MAMKAMILMMTVMLQVLLQGSPCLAVQDTRINQLLLCRLRDSLSEKCLISKSIAPDYVAQNKMQRLSQGNSEDSRTKVKLIDANKRFYSDWRR